MKNLKLPLLLLFALLSTQILGDIIYTKPKVARLNVSISNLDDFPELTVIGVNGCVNPAISNKPYRVKPGEILKVQRTCPLSLYAMSNEYYKQSDLRKLDCENDSNIQKLNLVVEDKSFNSNKYLSCNLKFNLANYNDSVFYLYKAKRTYKYRANKPDSVKVYSDTFEPWRITKITAASGHE